MLGSVYSATVILEQPHFMVRYAERQRLLSALRTALELQIIITPGNPSEDPFTRALADQYQAVFAQRYLHPRRPDGERRTSQWKVRCQQLLHLTPAADFRRHFRMTKEQFYFIHERILNDPIFVSQGKKPQACSAYQLLMALHRFTHYGNGSSAFESGQKFGCSGEHG